MTAALSLPKIDFQTDTARFNHKISLCFSFYFQLIDDKLSITFAHVHMPEKAPEEKFSKETLHADVKIYKEWFHQFENTNYIAAKSFFYKDDLTYCCVNDLFLKLIGVKNFIAENYSSLTHIHPNDQQKYFDLMQKIFEEKNSGVSEDWRWHNSYSVMLSIGKL